MTPTEIMRLLAPWRGRHSTMADEIISLMSAGIHTTEQNRGWAYNPWDDLVAYLVGHGCIKHVRCADRYPQQARAVECLLRDAVRALIVTPPEEP